MSESERTDRELLDLAAKAAGYDVGYENTYLTFFRQDVPGRPIWNPLNDDGDALRLAVKLNLVVNRGVASSSELKVFATELDAAHFEPYAATRRAIVKAAAEIGRGME